MSWLKIFGDWYILEGVHVLPRDGQELEFAEKILLIYGEAAAQEALEDTPALGLSLVLPARAGLLLVLWVRRGSPWVIAMKSGGDGRHREKGFAQEADDGGSSTHLGLATP